VAARPVEVVTLGECLVALVAEDPGPLAEVGRFVRHVAGSEANLAVGLVRLGHGVGYIGRVGADGFGTAIVRRLRGEGVDVRFMRVDDAAPTGLMVRERRVLGAADVRYYRAGSAGSRLCGQDVDDAAEEGLFQGARWLHVTGITPALSDGAGEAIDRALGHARRDGATVSLDINLRRRLWSDERAAEVLRPLASRVDVVFGGADEAAVVAGDDGGPEASAAHLLDLGPSCVVIKLGAEGALAQEAGHRAIRQPPVSVPVVVDPVGAGDAFCAGFIAARLEGLDIGRALELAGACGAAAIAALGDLAGLPERAEVDRLLDNRQADTIR
jgi:2-dehydro-3-deoxygluconokinase